MLIKVPTTYDKNIVIGEMGGKPYMIRPSDWTHLGETMTIDFPDGWIGINETPADWEIVKPKKKDLFGKDKELI